MDMPFSVRTFSLASASIAFTALPSAADALAETPTVTGNGWVALAIIGVFVTTIYMLIMGALHVERRDAELGKRRDGDSGWYGLFPPGDDDNHDGGHGHHW
jgi:hypothetical protein